MSSPFSSGIFLDIKNNPRSKNDLPYSTPLLIGKRNEQLTYLVSAKNDFFYENGPMKISNSALFIDAPLSALLKSEADGILVFPFVDL